MLYPEFPATINHRTYFPEYFVTSEVHSGLCPICLAKWSTCRNAKDSRTWNSEGCVDERHPYPHIAYKCGGIYRELPDKPGFWGGRCFKGLKQKVLDFQG